MGDVQWQTSVPQPDVVKQLEQKQVGVAETTDHLAYLAQKQGFCRSEQILPRFRRRAHCPLGLATLIVMLRPLDPAEFTQPLRDSEPTDNKFERYRPTCGPRASGRTCRSPTRPRSAAASATP